MIEAKGDETVKDGGPALDRETQLAAICIYYEGDRDNPPDDGREFLVEMKFLRRARAAKEKQ